MTRAFAEGLDTYTPTFDDGCDMQPECGNPKITVTNLSRIVNPNRKVVHLHLGHGQVLVSFESGESYLATGFGYGHEQEEVHQLALFASKHGFGDHRELFIILSRLNTDYFGPIPPCDPTYPLIARPIDEIEGNHPHELDEREINGEAEEANNH